MQDTPNPVSSPFQILWFQWALLFALFLAGGLAAAGTVAALGPALGVGDMQHALNELQQGNYAELRTPVKIVLLLSHLCVFALPGLLFAYALQPKNPGQVLQLRRVQALPLLTGMVALFLSFPLVQWIYYANLQALPADAASLQNQAMQRALLVMENPMDLMANLLLVGLAAGVGEELLFRGALQGLATRTIGNAHAGIWLSAALFSLIHGEWQAFVPRLLLGALFGYMLLRSGSLWLPIVLHVFFNSIQVVAAYFLPEEPQAHMQPPDVVLSISLSLAAGLAYRFLWRMYNTQEEEDH